MTCHPMQPDNPLSPPPEAIQVPSHTSAEMEIVLLPAAVTSTSVITLRHTEQVWYDIPSES